MGAWPLAGREALTQTNEIRMAIPVLDGCALTGKDVTGDALLTQRPLARDLIERQAHDHFTVKGNQPTLAPDIAVHFTTRGAPDFVEGSPPEHGRIEPRRIWCSTALTAYRDFPHAGQVFCLERERIDQKTGTHTREIAFGITSRSPHEASPPRLLAINRGHWAIERVHDLLDWNDDEDRNRSRTGSGSANVTRLRRFAVGMLKSFQKPTHSIAELLRVLCFRTRLVFDDLRIITNSVTGLRGT